MIATASMLISVVLTISPWDAPLVSQEFADLFQACEYRYTGGQYHDELFRYRLFVPRNLKQTKRYPLLVWLHGKGEDGSDNRLNLRWLEFILEDRHHLEKYPFFILAVQCPKEGPGWVDFSDSASGMVTVTYKILEKTLREQPIDPDRVYLSGLSAGGSACWEVALQHPDVFAAIVPMATNGGDVSRARRLVGVPIWTFHNTYDDAPMEGDQQMVAAVNRAGGNARLTIPRSLGHECWQVAFQCYGIMDWMLEQRRGAWIRWTPPGCRPWKWWHVFGVPAAFVAILGASWYSERRRKRQVSQNARAPERKTAEDDVS